MNVTVFLPDLQNRIRHYRSNNLITKDNHGFILQRLALDFLAEVCGAMLRRYVELFILMLLR